MGDLLTALGTVLVLVVGAWHVGSPPLRAAALCCYLGAGLLLLAAGQGDVSPWAAPALFGWGTACWTLGHCLHRLRRGRWHSPLAAPAVLRAATATTSSGGASTPRSAS